MDYAYQLFFTDSGQQEKSIFMNQLNTSGAGNISALRFTVKDNGGTVVDLTGLTTSTKIYIGIEGDLKINGRFCDVVSAVAGTLIYRLESTFLTVQGTYSIEVCCADNNSIALATKAITVGRCKLNVYDSLTIP